MKKKNFITVLLSFFKVGALGFGGGAALIPVIEEELVGNKKWIDKENYDLITIVSSITPGSLPVSLSALWNQRYSVLSAYFYALPGALMLLALLTGFSFIGENGILLVSYASVGISTFIMSLLFIFVKKVYRQGVKSSIKNHYILIILVSFLLTSGKSLRRLAAVLFSLDYAKMAQPVFSIQTITLILIAFYIICFMGDSKSILKFCSAALLSFFYALSSGKMGILSGLSNFFAVLMLFSVTGSIAFDMITSAKNKKITEENIIPKKQTKFDLRPVGNILLFILIPVFLTVICYALARQADIWGFVSNIVISTVTSFGGGEAYISVAEGIFVQNEYITSQVYFGQIVAVTNALPGPVLIKIASGIGYAYGAGFGGFGVGWLFSILGLSLTTSVTSIGALTAFMFFDSLKNSPRLHLIIKYILPAVCGILITTALSILVETLSVLSRSGINPIIGFVIVVVIFSAMLFIQKKFNFKGAPLLLCGGLATLTGLSLFNLIK